MLKISDYAGMMLSFLGMLLFYLIFAGNLSVNLGISDPLPTLELSEDFSTVRECNYEEPVFAVLCGGETESEKTKDIVQIVSNLKKEYAVFSTVDEITDAQAESITTFVVTAKSWEEIGDKVKLLQYVEEEGKNIIFAGILKEEEEGSYNKTIGVVENKGETTIDGIMIFEGMLIQGMVYYDELKMQVEDVTADARCTKLVIEKTEDKVEQKDLIPLVWEKRYGEGRFFVVNGDLLSMDCGMGIFTGILSQMEETVIYPVVNAKANLLDNFPEYNNPYEAEIKNLYSRDTAMFIRDIVWPSIVKLGESDTLVFSARVDQAVSEKDKDDYEYIEELMEKRGYEIDDSMSEPEIDLPYVSEGFKREDIEVFNMQSNISGFGLSTHYLDISEVMGKNAADPDYEWSGYSLELSKLMSDLYKDAEWMDVMSVSQAIERYKRYLVLEPVISKNQDTITIETKEFHDLCFYMIRTDKKVLSGEGYEVEKVGEDAYLIRVLQDKISIKLKGEEE